MCVCAFWDTTGTPYWGQGTSWEGGAEGRYSFPRAYLGNGAQAVVALFWVKGAWNMARYGKFVEVTIGTCLKYVDLKIFKANKSHSDEEIWEVSLPSALPSQGENACLISQYLELTYLYDRISIELQLLHALSSCSVACCWFASPNAFSTGRVLLLPRGVPSLLNVRQPNLPQHVRDQWKWGGSRMST